MCGPTHITGFFTVASDETMFVAKPSSSFRKTLGGLVANLVHTQTSPRPYRTSFWVALGWPIENSLESNRTRDLRAWSCIANNLD